MKHEFVAIVDKPPASAFSIRRRCDDDVNRALWQSAQDIETVAEVEAK